MEVRGTVDHPFAVTFDYRCPFACNVHERLVAALEAGAQWDVTFLPFSLGQAHVGPGEPDVWDDPARDTGLLAMQYGVAVRDRQPEAFPGVHRELFSIRHRLGRSLADETELLAALARAGADADAATEVVGSGESLGTIRKEHDAAVVEHDVWGVPTFVAGERAAFVRLDTRVEDDPDPTATIERLVDMLVGWPELNEFKHTTLER
jgi:hypothetical protein